MYIVFEIQEEMDGTVRVLEPAYFDDLQKALQKYYVILSYAVVSELARHSAMIVATDSTVIEHKCYVHTGA